MEVASEEAMPDTVPSRLAEVKAALPKLQAKADSASWVSAMPPTRAGQSIEASARP